MQAPVVDVPIDAVVDPNWMMAVGISNGNINASPVLVGTRIVAYVSCREGSSTIAPGWTELASHTAGYINLKVLTRLYNPNELGVASFNSGGASWSSMEVFAYAFEPDVKFAVDIPDSGTGAGYEVRLHQPTRPEANHRFRFLTGCGFYAWWETSTPPGNDTGSAGYIFIGTSSNGSIGENPVAAGFPDNDPHKALAPWSQKSWWSGVATHGTIGVAGPLHWIESHLYAGVK
jgi:hypothetical protein